MDKTIVQQHKTNFETLKRAFDTGHAGMIECRLKATGEKVAVIAAFVKDDAGITDITPFAMFFNGNPYELLDPPKSHGGFHTEEAKQV